MFYVLCPLFHFMGAFSLTVTALSIFLTSTAFVSTNTNKKDLET